MGPLRIFLATHYRLAAAVLALALIMKALVPAGFMAGGGSTVLSIEICADASGGDKLTRQIVVPRSGDADETRDGGGKGQAACPYASHAMPGLAAAPPALLALALAFILALGFAPSRVAPPRRLRHALPPLRGPPAFA